MLGLLEQNLSFDHSFNVTCTVANFTKDFESMLSNHRVRQSRRDSRSSGKDWRRHLNTETLFKNFQQSAGKYGIVLTGEYLELES